MRHHSPYVRTYVSKSAGAEHPCIPYGVSAALQAAVGSYLRQCTMELCGKMYVFHVMYRTYLCVRMYISVRVACRGETHTLYYFECGSASLGLTCLSCSFGGFLLQEVGEVVRLLNSELSVTPELVHPMPVLTAVCSLT